MTLFRIILLLATLAFFNHLPAQLTCLVVTEKNEPVSFAYVQAEAAGLLTTTSLAGEFTLPEALLHSTAVVAISSIGYETKTLPLNAIVKNNGKIVLTEKSHLLENVLVVDKQLKYRPQSFGLSKPGTFTRYGYNFSDLGYERGIIVSNDKLCKVTDVAFFTSSVNVDSFKVEFNFYDYSGDTIGQKLQTERILRTVKKSEAKSRLSLQLPNPVYVNGPFVVTIANLNNTTGVAMLEAKNSKKYQRIDRRATGWKTYEQASPVIEVSGGCSKQ